jgi:hypothetical protein
MDLQRVIDDLRAEVTKIEKVIRALEEMHGSTASPAITRRKPGRHRMGMEERKEVAERMRRYWSRRREEKPELNEEEPEILDPSQVQ